MIVLILTNPTYKDFVSDVVAQNREHTTFTFWGGRFEFPDTFSYDIGISFMYQYKVPAKEVNTHTWFNFHPAPLPEYKGRNLCYHAIMNGEISWGASLHYMDENFDTGDVVEVYTNFLYGDETSQDLSDLAIAVSKDLFVKYFPRIINGESMPRTSQVDYRVPGTYYRKSQIDDFIDLDYQTVETLERSIRAITYGNFYPKIKIGGVIYKIVKDD